MEYQAHDDEQGASRYWELAPNLWFPEHVRSDGIAPGPNDDELALESLNQQFRVEAKFMLQPSALQYLLRDVRLYVTELDQGVVVDARVSIGTESYRALRLSDLQNGISSVGRARDDLKVGVEACTYLPYAKMDAVSPALNPGPVWAAQVYARGSLNGRRPQKDVSEELGVSIATAGRRVREAIAKGYLYPALRLEEVSPITQRYLQDRTEVLRSVIGEDAPNV